MFIVSLGGSTDQKRPEPATLLLTADHVDAPGGSPFFTDTLLGVPQRCEVRPDAALAASTLPDEQRAAEVTREFSSAPHQRPGADQRLRSRAVPTSQTRTPVAATGGDVPPDLNFPAIRAALFNAAALARTCPGENVSGKVVVTFEPTGNVRSVEIPLLIGDTHDRACIERSFKGIRVPAFAGHPVAVKKDF